MFNASEGGYSCDQGCKIYESGEKKDKMDEKTVRLPSEKEIMKRFHGLDLGRDEHMEKFYMLIAQKADQEYVASGVVTMITMKIAEFVSSGYPPVMTSVLMTGIPLYIEALIDDEEVCEEAKAYYEEFRKEFRQS